MAGTIQQIADMAGVSRGTVDRALNHRGRISPEVAEQIEKIADEIGYITKSRKKEMGLASPGYQKTIGVITQLSRSSFMIRVKKGIEDVSAKLERQGIHVILKEISGVSEKEQIQMIDVLAEAGIDALAIMPVECEKVRLRLNRLAEEQNIPVVTFNSDIVGANRMCFVGLDNRKSGCVAAGLMAMLMRGRGKVLGITGDFSNSVSVQRIDGFEESLTNDFPDMEMTGVHCSHDQTVEVEQIICHTMETYPDLEGIFVASGGQEGIQRAFRKLGLEKRPYVILYDLTPKNIGYLRDGTADFLIDQEGYNQGYRALSLLADKLRWNKEPEQESMYTEINIKTKYSL